ncbi:MAG: PD40 domain-containing protein [Chloroflexi bacterium]|nr:PD40 domain-containing protein [Chloroflexota bacterium]
MKRSVFTFRPRASGVLDFLGIRDSQGIRDFRVVRAIIAGGIASLALAACTTGGAGDVIVFTSERDSENPDIYTVPGSGGEAQRLTNTSATEKDPVWSPSRDQIAFLSDRGDDFELYIMDSEGESEQVAVGGEGERKAFAWGPKGVRIAYISDHEGKDFIYVKDLELGQKFRLSTIDAPQALGSWSPDGEWIVFSVLSGERQGIHRKNPGGVDEVQLTENADSNPVYSPDGRLIAFITTRDAEASEIWVMKEDGQNERNLTRKPGADFDFDWSPDSKSLVFVSEREGGPEIFLISIDGEDPQRLTTNNSIESSPRFSPDGNRILFVSNSDGDSDIFSMRRDGSSQKRITATDEDDESPDW